MVLISVCTALVALGFVACGPPPQSTAAEGTSFLKGFPEIEGSEVLPWHFGPGEWTCRGPESLRSVAQLDTEQQETAQLEAAQPQRPLEFVWPGVDAAVEIPDTIWGYYHVPAPYTEVAAFYRENAVMLPFNQQELYWGETDTGIMGVYYQAEANYVYSRIWFMSQPDDDQQSFLIIMRNNDLTGCNCEV
jgi:hypothetical protein